MKKFKTLDMLFRTATATAVMLLFQFNGLTQVFNPAGTAETLYPPLPPLAPSNPVSTTTHSSCYSFDRGTGFGHAHLLVHGWDDVAGLPGISWRALDPGMMLPYNEGYVNYPSGVRDLEVAMYHDPMSSNGWYVIAAYYNTNVNMGVTGMGVSGMPLNAGHYYDLWDWTPGGLVYVSTAQLSGMPNYTRISIDAHLGYGIVVAWEEPAGIMVKALEAGMGFGPTVVVTGTAGERFPDVAFSHTGTTGTPGIHLVYNKCIRKVDPESGIMTMGAEITESLLNWGALIPPSTLTSVLPVIEDVNFIPRQCGDFRTFLDCPDHSGPDDWAYSYVDISRNKVYVRIMDQGLSPTAITHCLNDGSLAGLSAGIDMQAGAIVSNDWPVLSYQQNMPDLYVGWHTQWDNYGGFPSFGPPFGMYVGFSMSTAGAITSATDYNLIPTNTALTASSTPAITFSKNNEHPYLFAVYAMFDGADNQFYQKYQPWTNPTFKTTRIPEEAMGQAASELDVYPSPFVDVLRIKIPSEFMEHTMNIGIYSITGTLVHQYSGTGAGAGGFVEQASKKLQPGIYLIKVESGRGLKSVFKVMKNN